MFKKVILLLPFTLIAVLEQFASYCAKKKKYNIASKLSLIRLKVGWVDAKSELSTGRYLFKAGQYSHCLYLCVRAQKKALNMEQDSKLYLIAYSLYLVWCCAAKDLDNKKLDIRVCKKAFFDALDKVNFRGVPDHMQHHLPFPQEFIKDA